MCVRVVLNAICPIRVESVLWSGAALWFSIYLYEHPIGLTCTDLWQSDYFIHFKFAYVGYSLFIWDWPFFSLFPSITFLVCSFSLRYFPTAFFPFNPDNIVPNWKLFIISTTSKKIRSFLLHIFSHARHNAQFLSMQLKWDPYRVEQAIFCLVNFRPTRQTNSRGRFIFLLLVHLLLALLLPSFASWIRLTHEMSLIFFLEASIAVSLSCLLRCRFMILFFSIMQLQNKCTYKLEYVEFAPLLSISLVFLCSHAKWLFRMVSERVGGLANEWKYISKCTFFTIISMTT